MRKEIAEELADALESGQYEQTRGVLGFQYQDGSRCYCAEGVLADLAVQHGIIGPPTMTVIYDESGYLSYDGRTGSLSNLVLEWAGLAGYDRSIMRWNDFRLLSFPEIATKIRKMYIND